MSQGYSCILAAHLKGGIAVDLHQIVLFLAKHWQLSGILVLLIVFLVIEESRAQGGKQKIMPAALVSLINKDEAYIVDLRDSAVFDKGHIAGAMNMTKSELIDKADKLSKQSITNIVLVCQKGHSVVDAFVKLKKQGLTNILMLKGGMDAWTEDTLPTVKTERKKSHKKQKKLDDKQQKETSNG